MVRVIPSKKYTITKYFAWLPKRIGEYIVWLSLYYKTYDYSYQGLYPTYIPHWFVYEEDAIKYIEKKMQEDEYDSRT